MKKIRLEVGQTYEMTQEEALEFFSADAESLELLESGKGYRGILNVLSENTIQSAVIEKDFNMSNIDVWTEDNYEDCKDVIEIISEESIENLHKSLSKIGLRCSKLKEEKTYQEEEEEKHIKEIKELLEGCYMKMRKTDVISGYEIELCKIFAETEIKRQDKGKEVKLVFCNNANDFEQYCYNNYYKEYNTLNNNHFYSTYREIVTNSKILYNSKYILIGEKRHDYECEEIEIIKSKCDFIKDGIYLLKVTIDDYYTPIVNPETSSETHDITYVIYNPYFKTSKELQLKDGEEYEEN